MQVNWSLFSRLCLAVLSAIPACLAQAFPFYEPIQPPRAFQVMVHRGESHQAPENTRPAL